MGKVKFTVTGYRCERCDYQWIPRLKSYPKVCPHCKTPYWDKPRKKTTGNTMKALKDTKQ